MFEELLRSLGIGGEVLPQIARHLAPDPLAGMMGMAPKSAEAAKNRTGPLKWLDALSPHMMTTMMGQMQPRGGGAPPVQGMPPMRPSAFQYQPMLPPNDPSMYRPLGG